METCDNLLGEGVLEGGNDLLLGGHTWILAAPRERGQHAEWGTGSRKGEDPPPGMRLSRCQWREPSCYEVNPEAPARNAGHLSPSRSKPNVADPPAGSWSLFANVYSY